MNIKHLRSQLPIPVAVPGSCRISQKSTSPAFRMWSFKSCQDVLYGKLPTSGWTSVNIWQNALEIWQNLSKPPKKSSNFHPKLSSECHAKTRVFPDPFPWTLGSENCFQYTKNREHMLWMVHKIIRHVRCNPGVAPRLTSGGYKDKVDVITLINILFTGGGEFWSLMKVKLMLLSQSTYCS